MTALVIHGGGFTAGGKEWVPVSQLQELTTLGFVAVSVNYRLCPTISLSDGPLSDCKDCYAWCGSVLPDLLERDNGVLVDPSRMVVMGHSAGGHLALMMAQNAIPPLAILDFYGAKYLSDDFWHRRNPNMPVLNVSQELLDKIWLEVPPPSTSIVAQSNLASQEMEIDFTRPRIAWLASCLAEGTLVQHIVPPDGYACVEPTMYFKPDFPPVFFIHGTADSLVPFEFSEKAYSTLRQLGVAAELRLVDGAEHAFDEKLKMDNPIFEVIQEGIRFLAQHAKLL
ncbi:Alpha/Beta hydrolase protein [Aspergillus pseudodeflectus]|uniref:Alpha/Beta hydrolase protein n=1 Tax=Aspergillus pseudodeflectus TaxID=176178 RepID=A0ABR4KJ02_9EURO